MLVLLIILGVVILSCIYIGFNIAFLILSLLLLVLIISRGINLYNEKFKADRQKNKLNIVNVEKGGVFKLTGVGENSDEITLQVLAKHLYRAGDYYWYELECDKGEGEKVFVDVEIDDYVVVSVVLEKLTMNDIKLYSSLAEIDDNESGLVYYKQRKFFYKESDEAIFYRFCDDKKSEKFYYWDFKDNYNIISIEKWGKKDYDVYYCQKMKSTQITILSNKGK